MRDNWLCLVHRSTILQPTHHKLNFVTSDFAHDKNILDFYNVMSIRNIRICFIHPTIIASFKVKLKEFCFILVTKWTYVFHLFVIGIESIIYSCYQQTRVNPSTNVIIFIFYSNTLFSKVRAIS
jgi:hypothetical protein